MIFLSKFSALKNLFLYSDKMHIRSPKLRANNYKYIDFVQNLSIRIVKIIPIK